jgi:MFS family permease
MAESSPLAADTSTATAKASAWTPLRIALFRALWGAALVSNIGSAMHSVGASWLITSLSPSAAVIATLQSAVALPSFLLALPAGAFADVFDRRRLLIGAQAMMLIAAALLGVLTLSHRITVTGLLLLSVLLSIGGTINMPNWIAITPEIVGRDQLLAASSLNSISMNLSLAIGPAVAGLLIAQLGVGWVFVVNAISFVAVIFVVARWKRERAASTLPAEHIGAAIRTGVRYVRNEPSIATVLVRLGGVMVFAAANGALMPVLARQRVQVSAGQFGTLTAATGTGAVLTALAIPKLRAKFGPDVIATFGGFLLAAALFGLGRTTSLIPFTTVLVIAGAAQLCIFSTVFSTAQAVLPNWVRGRGLAIAMLVVQGVTFAASLVWGSLMSSRGAPFTLGVAGVGLAIVTVLMLPLRLRGRADVDLSPAEAVWPHPHTALDVDAVRGPVLVKVTYPVQPLAKDQFVRAMDDVRRQRRRNGAMSWALYDDVEQPNHLVETFKFATWAEHEREQQRRTAADASLHTTARAHLVDGSTPSTVHYLGVRTSTERHLPRLRSPGLEAE